jgi:hypothetical protein
MGSELPRIALLGTSVNSGLIEAKIHRQFIANSSLHGILVSNEMRESNCSRVEAAKEGGTSVVGKGRKL